MYVGWLGSAPRLVGRIGSVVQVSASFQKKFPVRFRSTAAREGSVMTWGLSWRVSLPTLLKHYVML